MVQIVKAGRNHTRKQAEKSSLAGRQRGAAPRASFMFTGPSRRRHSRQTACWGSAQLRRHSQQEAEGGSQSYWKQLKTCLQQGKNAEYGCGHKLSPDSKLLLLEEMGEALLTFIEQRDGPIHLLLENFHSRGASSKGVRKHPQLMTDCQRFLTCQLRNRNLYLEQRAQDWDHRP